MDGDDVGKQDPHSLRIRSVFWGMEMSPTPYYSFEEGALGEEGGGAKLHLTQTLVYRRPF